MRKGFRYILFATMGTVLTACPPPCDYHLIDFGSLSEEAISSSPYIDGQTYSFLHSEGYKISFYASRSREKQSDYYDECTEVRRESDLSTLTPDYPIFPCNIGIHKTDTARYECLIWAGGSSFWLPCTMEIDLGHSYFDSIQIGQNWYREVYKMGNNWRDGIPEGQILADSIFYNTAFGILKIEMSNGEFYEISD
ncbi:MAG: hypothetical protein P1P86_06790 [Bacteroidales bacterium]|nr:hypothetical protein [Bacteroidales bacterium]